MNSTTPPRAPRSAQNGPGFLRRHWKGIAVTVAVLAVIGQLSGNAGSAPDGELAEPVVAATDDQTTGSPAPTETVTVTEEPEPAEVVTVTTEPQPAETVTVTAEPQPVETAEPTPEPEPTQAPELWDVVDVVDGDTIDVRAPDGTEERIRFIGIDTPERGECGYGEASTALADLVFGQQVRLVAGAVDNRDRYDRLLRYVDVDGTDAGKRLLESGLAVARYDSRDGYGRHTREDEFIAADEAAEDITCGDPDPEPAGDCHPAYTPCIPPPSPDLDCGDVDGPIHVDHTHGDPHRFDGDGDGVGCEG